jgi:transcriptional regulator with GAF, ATPase, and Fis domain
MERIGMEEPLELVMTPTLGAAGVRVRLVKRITSIGSAPDADLRFHSLPTQWATVHRDAGAAMLRVLGDGADHRLAPGERIVVDGMTVELERPDRGLADGALDDLASRLAAVDGPGEALGVILDGVVAATGADLGAIIAVDGAGWTVAAARDAAGAAVDGAAELLSDPIVRDVLETGDRVVVSDVGPSARHARAASVAALGLGSALCLPLRLDGRTLGAILVGARDRHAPLGERAAADLRLLTTLAVPLVAQVRHARQRRDAVAAQAGGADLLVGESQAIAAVRGMVQRIGPTDLSVLVLGAPGTGKELVARALHAASGRAARRLVAVHCAAVPASLLDAELFGTRKGAVPGAAADRGGLIEAADGSTLFLDEVGDLPLAMQAALVRVLEDREVRRLGETTPRRVDVRLVAATHRDLVADVTAGRFREDLLFRLHEMRIDLPPLCDRDGDVLLLARLFLRQAEAQLGLPAHALAADAIELLSRYPWPGNVRELRAAMRRAAIVADGAAVRGDDLQLAPVARPPTPTDGLRPPTPPFGSAVPAGPALGDTTRPLADARDDFVRRYVAAVLDRCGGNREAAAKELAIGVRTLYRYLGA